VKEDNINQFGEIIDMKRIIIAALVILALGITGCSVGTGSGGIDANTGVQLPDDDPTNPFEIQPPADDDKDPVVVDDDDDPADEDNDPAEPIDEDETVFKMQTDAEDVLTEAVKGTYYEQTFRMLDKGIDYTWSVQGLPENSGLSLEEEANSWRYKLSGTPAMADIGTRQITITVVDANDSGRSTEISFELTVDSDMGELQVDTDHVDPCSLPLRIVVEGFGGHVDDEILNDGKFRAHIGSDANIKLRAIRGNPSIAGAIGPEKAVANTDGGVVAPVGEVKWTWKSKVRDSYHCRPVYRDDDHGPGYSSGENHGDHENRPNDQDRYEYSWASPNPDSCEGRYEAGVDGEWRMTKNPTWTAGNVVAIDGSAAQAPGRVLNLSGKILYDGPLPVKELPLDQDAVEVIEVTATDGCSAGGMSLIATKTLEIGIVYPINGEGGRIEDVEVDMDYEDVRNYWESGLPTDVHSWDKINEPGTPPEFDVDCDNPELSHICDSESKFVIIFTDGNGPNSEAWGKFENDWDLLPAIEQSFGYSFYDFEVCDENEDLCEERLMDHLNVPGQSKSLGEVKQIYLLWVVPPKISGEDTHYADFDIEEIEFKTKYWYAEFEDELNDFDDNITKNYVRSSCLTNRDRFPGMSPANSKGGVFRRRELAGYIPTP